MSLQAISRQVSLHEASTKAASFAAVVRSLMITRGDFLAASKHAEAHGKTQAADVLRAAVTAGSLSTHSQIAPFSDLFSSVLEGLRSISCFDAMRSDMRIVPLQSRVLLISGGADASSVAEGAPAPVSQLSLSASTMPLQKAVAIVACSEELLMLSGSTGETLLMNELRGAVATQTDSRFVSALTSGVTPLASSGTTVTAATTDLRAALAAVTGSASSRYWLITTPAICKQLSMSYEAGSFAFPGLTPTGGNVQGVKAFASDGVPAGQIVMVDAAQIVAGDDGGSLDYSDQADLQMSSTPDSPPSASTVMLGLWQSNMRALKFSRSFAVLRPRIGAVSLISGAAYGP